MSSDGNAVWLGGWSSDGSCKFQVFFKIGHRAVGVRNSSFPLHWPLAYSSPCSFGLIHTLCSKKGRHQTHCCKCVNSNQHFKFFFSVRFSSKFAANDLLRIPLHLICVATLPCGILMSEKERQSPTNVVHTHTHTRLTALFPGLPR